MSTRAEYLLYNDEYTFLLLEACGHEPGFSFAAHTPIQRTQTGCSGSFSMLTVTNAGVGAFFSEVEKISGGRAEKLTPTFEQGPVRRRPWGGLGGDVGQNSKD